jgi:hypothetical protein
VSGISELRVPISGIDNSGFDFDTIYNFKVFYRLYFVSSLHIPFPCILTSQEDELTTRKKKGWVFTKKCQQPQCLPQFHHRSVRAPHRPPPRHRCASLRMMRSTAHMHARRSSPSLLRARRTGACGPAHRRSSNNPGARSSHAVVVEVPHALHQTCGHLEPRVLAQHLLLAVAAAVV